MPLIDYEFELILTQSENCVIISTQNSRFTITETNLHVPVVTLSNQDNANLLSQLKSGFERKISIKARIISTECKIKSFN